MKEQLKSTDTLREQTIKGKNRSEEISASLLAHFTRKEVRGTYI